MSANLWLALGTAIATLAFVLIPSVVYAHVVLESWIDGRQSYDGVIAAVERGKKHAPSIG